MIFLAYIGPGAGFAVMGSFLIFIGALLLGLLILLSLPFRLLFSLFIRRARGRFKRVVIVGLDGMDPRRAKRLMDAGRLPRLKALAEAGHFSPLGSTCPPISPVAWSTFATGVNPGKHQIFDFLSRDLTTCLPLLSSTRITTTKDGGIEAKLLRKSKPFWHILSEKRVSCTALRMPISFPPEPSQGRSLAAMCTPDLRGTQGEFTVFTAAVDSAKTTGGKRLQAQIAGNSASGMLPGPTIDGQVLQIPFKVAWKNCGPSTRAVLSIAGRKHRVQLGRYSPWIALTFKRGRTKVHGIARFLLKGVAGEFCLYVTPLNLDPAHPDMPLSWPKSFSIYLAKLIGPYATLGLAEDTWGLSEGVLSDDDFETQTRDIHTEREAMFFESLRLIRRGFLVCVFDITDRMQHMFIRRPPQPDPEKPLAVDEEADERINRVYELCDALIGRTMRKLGKKDLLLVLSDHGFTAFRRCVHLNAWLRDNGYLVEKPEALRKQDSDYFANVDWERTRAYSFGLAGVYLNLKGREARGIVSPGAEAAALTAELRDKLAELSDPLTGKRIIRTVYEGAKVYSGPYTANAPELIIGWRSGYRHSWETAVGATGGEVFSDNEDKWCGDHCMDRLEVPGVLFCNRRIAWEDHPPHLADFAPSMLKLWNIEPPRYMDGKAWTIS